MKYIMTISKDQKGLVTEISELLSEHQINIDSINAHSELGLAEVRRMASGNDKSLSILNNAGFKTVPGEHILVKIEDTPGALGRISRTLSDKNIDIRGIIMIAQSEGTNIVAIITDQDSKARKILNDILVK